MPRAPDQVMVNEVLRAGPGAGLVEGHDNGAGKSGAGQKPQLGPLVREAELRGVGAEKPARMRLKGQCQRRAAMRPAHFQGCSDHGAMAEMNAVEIAHRDHGAPRNSGVRRGVADNGKMRSHQGNSRAGGTGRDRGATGRMKSSGRGGRIECDFRSTAASPVNALFNASVLVLERGTAGSGLAGPIVIFPGFALGESRWRLICRCRFWWLMTTAP
ncbi:hypothetical protein ACVWW7_002481 [Bradyrhizobium sp. LM6.9]